MLLEDASGYRGEAERILVPATVAEIVEILRDASRDGIPVTITGARTGLAGGGIPIAGWALSLEKLNRIDVSTGRAIAGPAVLLRDLQIAARPSGQFFAPDPTENTASLGGAIATNASGSRSFRYGAVRQHVLGLRVVLMDGQVLSLRRGDPIDFPAPRLPVPATTKNSTGFPLHPQMDYVDLFCGSEGTLGVIVEAEVRLLPLPKELFAGVIFFDSEEKALNAVDDWRDIEGIRMIEFFDRGSLQIIGTKSDAALLIEQELSNDQEEERWVDRLETAGALTDASWFAASDRDRERFRVFRHSVPEKVNDTVRRNGLQKAGTDFAVPVNRSREMMAYYRQTLDPIFPGQYVVFGHIGDAHVHVNILPKTPAEAELAKATIATMAKHAVELGGVVAAEHGLGKRKAALLQLQYNPEQIEWMKAVKRRFDPQWLLGRGTLFGE